MRGSKALPSVRSRARRNSDASWVSIPVTRSGPSARSRGTRAEPTEPPADSIHVDVAFSIGRALAEQASRVRHVGLEDPRPQAIDEAVDRVDGREVLEVAHEGFGPVRFVAAGGHAAGIDVELSMGDV